MEGIYKVNLIPSDLTMEETVLQIANTLDNLNGIVDDVFTRVMDRIKQNTDKTNRLKERIEVSRLKVEKLAGMQKAIKVFSSSKYPTSIIHSHYQSIFDLDGYQYKPNKITLSGKPQRPSNEKGIQVFSVLVIIFNNTIWNLYKIYYRIFYLLRKNCISSTSKWQNRKLLNRQKILA